MIFSNVNITNFLAVGNASIDLKNRGLVLIQGQNNESTAANSNGAGKSSLVDAICWCLYGVTARGVTGNAVVNRTAGKNTSVTIHLTDESTGELYVITRKRKPNSLEVVVDLGVSPPLNLTAGTEAQTQEVINRIVGCSREVFMSAVYAGQEAMPDLPGMTDKSLKLLIEESAGVEELARAYDIAKTHLLAMKSVALSNNAAVAVAKASFSSHTDQLAKFVNLSDQHGAGVLAEFQDLMERTKNLLLNPPVNASGLDHSQYVDMRNQLDKILTDISVKVGQEKTECDRLTAVANNARWTYTNFARDTKAAAAEYEKAKTAVKDVEDSVGKPCQSCAKVCEEHDIEAVKKIALSVLEEKKNAAKKVYAEMKLAEATSNDAAAELDKYRKTMLDSSKLVEQHRALSKQIDDYEAFFDQKKAYDEKIKALVAEKTSVKNRVNPFAKMIHDANIAIAKSTDEVTALENKGKECQRQVEIAMDAVEVFGPAGVRAHILDTVTPFLNDKTSEYLAALSDGSISAIWTTLSKTAKGEVREKFSIDVSNSQGAETFFGLSGGEKRKVRLACAMALQDLVATRATKPIALFIADEVDHALDESGLERLMAVLENKARERGTVLVISHNSLADWIDTVITVVKESGYAKIDGS